VILKINLIDFRPVLINGNEIKVRKEFHYIYNYRINDIALFML